jgi:hypothetical protein
MNHETFGNQIAGLIRAAVPVLAAILVFNGWVPEAMAGPFVDALIILSITGLTMWSSWRSNRLADQTKRVAAAPDVTVTVGPYAPEEVKAVAEDPRHHSVIASPV